MAQFELVVNQVNFEEKEITSKDELKCFGDLYSCDTDLLESNSYDSHPITPRKVNLSWDANRQCFVREDRVSQPSISDDENSSSVVGDSFKSFAASTETLAIQKSFIGNRGTVMNVPSNLLPRSEHDYNHLHQTPVVQGGIDHLEAEKTINIDKSYGVTPRQQLMSAVDVTERQTAASAIDGVVQPFYNKDQQKFNGGDTSLGLRTSFQNTPPVSPISSVNGKRVVGELSTSDIASQESPGDVREARELIRVPKESITVVKQRTVNSSIVNHDQHVARKVTMNTVAATKPDRDEAKKGVVSATTSPIQKGPDRVTQADKTVHGTAPASENLPTMPQRTVNVVEHVHHPPSSPPIHDGGSTNVKVIQPDAGVGEESVFDLTTVDGLCQELRKLKLEKARLEGQISILHDEFEGTLTERSSLQTQLAMQVQKLKANELDLTELSREKAMLDLEISNLRQDRARLEQAVLEAHRSRELKEAEIAAVEEDLQLTKETNEKLQTKQRELRQELNGKESVLKDMKTKVAELYVQVQTSEQNKLLMEGELKSQRSEVNSLKSSNEWHRSQLDKAQEAKAELRKEVTKLKGDLVAQATAAERLKAECTRVKSQLSDVQERALHDKEALARHLESIEMDMMENETAFVQLQQERDALLRRLQQLGDTASPGIVETQVAELEDKLHTLDSELRQNKQQLVASERSLSEVTGQLRLSQEALLERDRTVSEMERRCQEMEGRLVEMLRALEEAKSENKRIEESKMTVDQELASLKEEKRMFDGALETFRLDMAKVEISFRTLKQELALKTQELEELRAHNSGGVSGLPQQHIVSNNFTGSSDVSRTEELNSMHTQELQQHKLNAELKVMEEKCQKLLNERDSAMAEVNLLQSKVAEFKQQLESERAEKDLGGKPGADLAATQIVLLKEQLERVIIEKSEQEKQLLLGMTEKMEYEKQLQELRQQSALQAERFEAYLNAADQRAVETVKSGEQQIGRDDNAVQELEMMLEKERSKLSGLQRAYSLLKDHVVKIESQLANREAVSAEVDSGLHRELLKKEKLISDLQNKIKLMQDELDREKRSSKDLKKQLMMEKGASVKNRRQLEEMWATQDQLQAELELAKRAADTLLVEKNQLTELQQQTKNELACLTAECNLMRTQLDTLHLDMEESRLRETMLQEKIETQDWQLNNKILEVEGLRQQMSMTEERQNKELEAAVLRSQNLATECNTAKEELAAAKAMKATLHSQTTELKNALQTVLKQQQGGADNPTAFSSLDLERLLQQNYPVHSGQNRSLSFLQSTLAGLRLEISSLHSQMEQHSSAVQNSRQAWSELENHVQELRSLCQTSAADRAAGEKLVAEGEQLLLTHSVAGVTNL